MESSIVEFHKKNTNLQYTSFHFTYYMYILLEHINMTKHVERHSSAIHITKMCCDIVIMQNMYYLYLHTKFNLNNTMLLYQFQLKALHWNTLIPLTKTDH